MTTASDISHPAYLHGNMSKLCIIFRVVQYFVICNDETCKNEMVGL